MQHPALTQMLAAAHIEDLRRAAARGHATRLDGSVVHEPRAAATPIAVLRSASTRLRRRRAPQPDGMARTEIPGAAARPPGDAHKLEPDRTAAGRLALRRWPRSAR